MSETASTAVRSGNNVRTADNIAVVRRLLDRGPPSGHGNAAYRLALAGEKLLSRSDEAVGLYSSVADEHDLRDAWLGLACAYHLRAEPAKAAGALGRALRNHAFIPEVAPFVQLVSQAIEAPGWCALDNVGDLIVRLPRAPPPGIALKAMLDGRPLALRPRRVKFAFGAHLPEGWDRAAKVVVSLDGVELLGSPIGIDAIVRVEGFVDSLAGDLHGWAWCPHAPGRDPVLSIEQVAGGVGITVVANSRAVGIQHDRPLAVPRGFRIPPDQLRRFNGLVRVRGAGSDHLTGSPLDPSAERRGAEKSTRIIADLFPAPGQRARVTSRDLSLVSVPAHVIGGPVTGGLRRRQVDVVIPVYGGLERTVACLDSVTADLPPWARVIVVDDASPDPCVGQVLGGFAALHRITLLTQRVNRGFPGTANIGMRNDAARDVVLLNSDTLVPTGWLTALREAAYSASDIGSATPFSNDATILSYPSVQSANAVPELEETRHLNSLARRANAGLVIDIPTAVAFCTYIKRDCLNATGLLREDVFAQGYGEENDFCLRARHLGWRHVAVPSMFVAHVGGHSFGSRRQLLMERNLRKLNELHPGYDSLIQEFRSIDPLTEPRRRFDMERWKTFRTRTASVLLITHNRAGGVRRHVAERAAALRAEGLRPIVLWPAARRPNEGYECVLGNGPEGGMPNLRFSIPGELDLLARLLKADHPVRAEVHHMIGHDHELMGLFRRLGIPYEIFVHDYSWLCPRVTLIGPERRYCGEPDMAGCEACVADAGSMNEEDTPPRQLRERSAIEMTGASSVVVPSEDVAVRLKRHLPSVEPRIVEWENDRLLSPPHPWVLAADGIRRVCIIGAIGIDKGYDILLACARDAVKRKLNLRFHLVGHTSDDARLLATGAVRITGEYQEHELLALIDLQQAQLAWLPSLWPETWCYTLTQAWQAGLNVLAFDLGTPAERIRRTGRGWIVPLGLATEHLNNQLLVL